MHREQSRHRFVAAGIEDAMPRAGPLSAVWSPDEHHVLRHRVTTREPARVELGECDGWQRDGRCRSGSASSRSSSSDASVRPGRHGSTSTAPRSARIDPL